MYSWLDCEPDDLYKLTQYSVYELQDGLPLQLQDYLLQWWQDGQGMHLIGPWLTSLGQVSFVARPMQVSKKTYKIQHFLVQ